MPRQRRSPGPGASSVPGGQRPVEPAQKRRGVLRGDTIANRLARILAWPLVTVALLLTIVMVRNASDYATASETNGSVSLALQVQDLIQEVQVERGLTSGLLGGNAGFRDELPPQRKRVDAERAALAQSIDSGANGSEEVRTALRQFESLDSLRTQVDSGKAARVATFQYYTDRITALNDVDFDLDQSQDAQLRRGVAALRALGDYKEQTAQKRAYLNGVFSASGFVAGEYIQFSTVTATQQAALAQYNRQASGAQQTRLTEVLDTGAASEATYFEGVALAAADGRVIQVNPQSWWSALTTVMDDIREVQESVGDDIQHRAGQLRSDAQLQLIGVLALALMCLAGGVIVVASATRSITGPLAALASEAEALAATRLPEAVAMIQSSPNNLRALQPTQVSSRASSEIRSVAIALDKVQATAHQLATQQALMRYNTTQSLANLGRRNQNLIRRQLGFISRLERDETDPGSLSNLFELDHLATRMRRNAESLLVLVGESTSRNWSQPMPIADVIRAALSEVEEYRRVSLRRIDEAYLTGTFVTGVAHMIAELLENGLTFSPPDLDVEVQGRKVGQDYLIAITDQGVGIEPGELDRANARLRGEENFLLAPAQFLGHYVVGQLAQQMQIDVQIARSPVTGITARITLPGHVLSRPGELGPAEVDKIVRDALPATPQVTPQHITAQHITAQQPRRQPQQPQLQQPVVAGLAPSEAQPASPWNLAPQPAPSRSAAPPGAPARSGTDRAPFRMAPTTPAVPANVTGHPGGSTDPVENASICGALAAPTAPLPVLGLRGSEATASPSNAADWWTPRATQPEAEEDPNRTRNGLLKRTTRGRGAARGQPVAHQGGVEHDKTISRGGRTVERTPDDLRSRLTSLRAGVHRGETARLIGSTTPTTAEWEGNGHEHR
ncbi:MAG: nitrate- and nitrite sensing domain-containing protein [Micromonosporaceae bacterium]|nr:nitrate- and nitrite sensing domain-containing protein [Micromonosporaceae bacterium]